MPLQVNYPRLCGRLGPIVKKWFWGALSPSLTKLFCRRHDSTNFVGIVGKSIFLKIGRTNPFHG